jgi:hypothetical protein
MNALQANNQALLLQPGDMEDGLNVFEGCALGLHKGSHELKRPLYVAN